MDLASILPPLVALLVAGAGALVMWGQLQTRIQFLRKDIELQRSADAELHARVDKRKDEVAKLSIQCALFDQKDGHLDSLLKQLSQDHKALMAKFDELVKEVRALDGQGGK